MNPKRRLLVTAGAALLSPMAWQPACAQGDNWPSRPIRFIVPFTAGGANDLLGRAAAEGASKVLGQQVIIENKPGSGTVLGTELAARSAADGYTWLVSSAGVLSNSLIRKVGYKDDQLVPVAMIGLAPSVVVVPADSPYKTLKDLVDASRKSAQGLHWSTAGTGSTPHFVQGLLETKYGARLDLVPYKSGAESITAVLSGQVDATSEASIVVLPYVRAGKLRALADTWSARISAYPELATAAEQGFPDIRIAHWAGLHAPAGVAPAILDRMAAAVDAAMKNDATQQRLKALGIEPIGGTRASFGHFIDEERARLGAVVKATGMKEE
jgi:tripartite-type tricarboxylate transporter receptor subunit TctC